MKELVIEAQKISPTERHQFIFKSFEDLKSGDALLIVNSHDPVPLIQQFHQRCPDQFAVEYTLRGPQEWRVRLTKVKKESCCGSC